MWTTQHASGCWRCNHGVVSTATMALSQKCAPRVVNSETEPLLDKTKTLTMILHKQKPRCRGSKKKLNCCLNIITMRSEHKPAKLLSGQRQSCCQRNGRAVVRKQAAMLLLAKWPRGFNSSGHAAVRNAFKRLSERRRAVVG